MINPEENYSINGWAIKSLVDIIKSLKTFVEKNNKKYTKDEYVKLIDSYDFAVQYLLNLKSLTKKTDTYNGSDLPDLPDNFKALLSSFNIRLDRKPLDENDTATEI